MKSFTDIEQSKKLVNILPLESADMYWMHVKREGFNDWWKVETIQGVFKPRSMDIPCWSLAALIEAMPKQLEDGYWWLQIDYIHHAVSYLGRNESVLHYILLNNKPLIDACVEMILNLYKVGYLKVEGKK